MLGYRLTEFVSCWCALSAGLQLQAEVKRLEELKLRNIQDLTKAIRDEITVLWEKCFYSADQRQAFLPYYDGKQKFWLVHSKFFCFVPGQK